jgi:hypothetical protein
MTKKEREELLRQVGFLYLRCSELKDENEIAREKLLKERKELEKDLMTLGEMSSFMEVDFSHIDSLQIKLEGKCLSNGKQVTNHFVDGSDSAKELYEYIKVGFLLYLKENYDIPMEE